MFGLTQVIFKATHARLSRSNVLVADGTIHTAWRKHNIFNFIRHFHVILSLPKFQFDEHTFLSFLSHPPHAESVRAMATAVARRSSFFITFHLFLSKMRTPTDSSIAVSAFVDKPEFANAVQVFSGCEKNGLPQGKTDSRSRPAANGGTSPRQRPRRLWRSLTVRVGHTL
jgi:hypothetical protein